MTASGEPYSYAECLVATGASPAVPPVPGIDGPGVYVLRTFDDALRLRAAVAAARGARPAGRRRAPSSSARRSPASRSPASSGTPGSRRRSSSSSPACCRAWRIRRARRSWSVACAPAATSFCWAPRSAPSSSAAAACACASATPAAPAGRRLADLVVVCAGSRPNLAFLAGGGFDTAAGLDVDERLRTAAPGLLAAGDVARTLDPVSGERVVVALWSSARRQGRVAGLTMAGVDARCPGDVPCNIQHAGDQLFASAGSFAAADRVDVDERGDSSRCSGFSARRLVGFNLLGDVRRAGPLLRALGRAPGDLAASRRVSAAVSLAAVREGMTWTTRSAG